MKNNPIIGFLAFAILWITTFYTVIILFSNGRSFFNETILGIAGLVTSTVIAFIKLKYGKLALGILLICGILNLVAFTPDLYVWFFNVASLSIRFQPFSLVLFLMLILLTGRKVNDLLIGNFTTC